MNLSAKLSLFDGIQMRYYSGVLNLQQFVYFRKNNKNNMKKTITSKFGLLMAMVAILISSCSTNATYTKRYHSRGFNIAWGGGSDATPAKSVIRKARVEAEKSAIVESPVLEMKAEEIASYSAPLSSVSAVNPHAIINNPIALATKVTQNARPGVTIEKKSVDTKVMVKTSTKVLKQKKAMVDPGQGKSQIIALILFVLFGCLGIHRFYLGHLSSGLLMLLLCCTLILPIINLFTGIALLVWWVLDLIKLVTGDLKPADGEYTETL
jgi:TM2 domain-containing membrane protein YozV